MATYRELVYLVLDELKGESDDFDFTEDSKDAVREVLIAKAAELNAKIDKIQNGNCNSSL